MKSSTFVCLCLAAAAFPGAPHASAQAVSFELAAGYDHLADDLELGEIDPGSYGLRQSGRFGLDGRVGVRTGERWAVGAAVSLTRARLSLWYGGFCEHRECTPSRTEHSQVYTEVASVLATGRHWPMGVADLDTRVRPLVGLHAGVLWHDDARDRNWGVPLGVDGGLAVAVTEETYLLTYVTGQMLLVSRRSWHDGFGFRLGFRVGLGVRL